MFLNAVYEADTLISAMENRANQYKDLREQLLVLKKTFKGISNSGDEFQGEGANAIKSFYEEQASIVNEWLTFIDMQIAFLRGVAAETEELKLPGHTYVDMDFLESDLLNGYRRSKDLVSDQKQDLDNILRSIDDLVSLQSFQTDTFDTHIDKAEKERKTTIDKVNELTEKLNYEYQQSEAVQEHIRNRFEALNDATRRGGQASPIYFDAKAYHNSSAYKLKDSVQHQAKSYLSFKKEQAERRKIEKLQKELETPNLSLDEYLKIAEDLGEENLTAEQKYIVDQIKASKQQGEIVKGVGAGLWEFTKDTATGVWNVLMTPPEQVLYDMGLAVINYNETIAQISEAIASSYERDMVNGNDYTRARWVTYAIATVGTSLVGTKGVDKIGKAGFGVGKKTAKNVKEAAANKLNAVNNSSSFTHRYSFAGGFEGVPYNVVDSLGLKDRLIMFEASNKGNRSVGPSGAVNTVKEIKRISEIKVSFKQNPKHDSIEFARQLENQEKGMKELTIAEYLKNRERYIAEGRALEGNAAQQAFREKQLSKKIEELFVQGLSWDEAENLATKWMNTQAALHNPDQIAGGNPLVIGGLGDRAINSSLGSQWRYRIDLVDEQIREKAKKMTKAEIDSTYLNINLTH